MAAIFAGETDFNGVVFDGFYKGGILVRADQPESWKNVSYGPGNHGERHELFALIPQTDEPVQPITIAPVECYRPKGERVDVALASKLDDATIRYSLDGTIPDRDDPRYDGPITVSEITVVTAAAFRDGTMYGLASRGTFEFAEPFNVARLADIAASASFAGLKGGLVSDASAETYWRGGTGGQQELTFTWDKPVTFDRIRIVGAPLKGWRLEVADGDAWKSVATGDGGLPAEQTMAPVTTERARLVLEKKHGRPVIHDVSLTSQP